MNRIRMLAACAIAPTVLCLHLLGVTTSPALGAEKPAVGQVEVGVRPEVKEAQPLRFSLYLIAYYTDNRDAWPDNEESTWDFYVKPRVDGSWHGRQAWLDLYYAPSYRYRTNPSEIQNETELQHEAGLEFRHYPTPRMELRLLEKFYYTDDPKIEEGNQMIRGDKTYLLSRTELGLIHTLTRRSSVDVYGAYTTKQYSEDEAAQTSDEDRFDVGLSVFALVSPRFAVLALGQYSDYGFSKPFGIDRDFQSALLAAGGEYIHSPNLRSGAKAGAQTVQYDDKELGSQVSFYGEAWIKGWTTPSTHLAGSVGHGVRQADAYPFPSQEYTEFRGSFEWELNRLWLLNLNGVYRVSDYDTDTLPSGVVDALGADPGLQEYVLARSQAGETGSGSETTTEVELGVTYRLSYTSTLKLAQRYENVESDVGYDYVRNSTALTFFKQF